MKTYKITRKSNDSVVERTAKSLAEAKRIVAEEVEAAEQTGTRFEKFTVEYPAGFTTYLYTFNHQYDITFTVWVQ